MVLLSESSEAQASFPLHHLWVAFLICMVPHGSPPHSHFNQWLGGKEPWSGSLLPYKGEEITLAISSHIPLARTWSDDNAYLQRKNGDCQLYCA